MVAFSSLQRRDTNNIRKGLDGAVLIGPATATVPTSLTTGASGDLIALPVEYVDLGWLDKGDGITEGRNVDSQEVESLGSAMPTRRDITKVDNTIQVTCQETNRMALQLFYGTAIAAGALDATTKELSIVEASRPAAIYYRCMVIWTDGSGTDAIYGATFYPRVSVTDMANKKISDGGDPIQYQITLTAYVDGALGYPAKHLHGGPGWQSRALSMGFS